MSKRIKLKDRVLPTYSKGEEIFNMTSHIVGGGIGVIATILCVVVAAIHNNVYGIVSGAIFGVTMIILYTMSSVYHGLRPNTTGKKVLQVLDHCSIFLLIAGSYTPFALCTLREYDALTRLVDFWNNLGNGDTRNSIKFNRSKKIQCFFNDLLSSNGLVHYCKDKYFTKITWNTWLCITCRRWSNIYNRGDSLWTRKKT